MNPPVFKIGSNANFCLSVFLRLVSFIAIIYLITVFNENPAAVSVALGSCGTFLLYSGNDEMALYKDKLIITNTSLFQVMRKSARREYLLKEVTHAGFPQETPPGPLGIGFMVILSALMPRKAAGGLNTFMLYKKDGSWTAIATDLGNTGIQKMIEQINKQVSLKN